MKPSRAARSWRRTPTRTGSLGIAISRGGRGGRQHDDTKYALGCVLNHVLLHQTVIGQEAIKQLEMAGDYPDIIVGCTGGGSNFAGIAFPFIGAQLRGGKKVRVDRGRAGGVPEPDARHVCLRLRRHRQHDAARQDAHAGHRRSCRPGSTPAGCATTAWPRWSSHVKELGLIEARAEHQTQCFEAGVLFARAEGIVPAPEANHAVKGGDRRSAAAASEEGASKVILFNLCGHGHFDMSAYTDYFAGKLEDRSYDEGELAMALAGLPAVPPAG